MTRILIVLLLSIALAWLALATTASAQSHDCGPAWAVIHGGDPSPFTLSQDAGGTLTLDSDAILRVETHGVPDGSAALLRFTGFGFSLDRSIGSLRDGEVFLNVSDHAQNLRGVYNVALVVQQSGHDLCVNRFLANIEGPASTIETASVGALAGTAALSLVSSIFASRGMDLKMKAQIQRRRRGWRRFVPVPAWKRMVVSMFVGALLGFAFSFYLQQDGIRPLSLASAIWSAVIGGGATFGVGYSLGAIFSFLRPPVKEKSGPG